MMYPPDWRVGGVPIIDRSSNTTRILMPGATIFGGRRPAPAEENPDKQNHNRNSSFAAVYFNRLAREALVSEPKINYPAGAVIVRERLTHADDKQPELLSVMIKRARGFNPAANDWEFLVIDPASNKIRERQKKGSCVDCHYSKDAPDFVFPAPAPASLTAP